MKAYYLVFIITFLLSIVLEAKTNKQYKWKLFFTFVPLFIYAAIRVDYGNDYPIYQAFFDEVHGKGLFVLDSDLHSEVGYQLFNQLMPSFRSILVLNAFMLSLALGLFCYNNIDPKSLWLAILLIFLNPEKNIFGSLVGIRTGLVITSFLIGSVLVQKRKLIPFAILVIGLSFIHKSAVLFLPIAYVVGINNRFTKKEVFMWAALIVLLLGLSMTTLFNYVSSAIDNDYLERYEYYLEEASIHRGYLSVVTNLIFVVSFIVYLIRRSESLTASENSFMRVGILFAVMSFLGSLSMRSSYFYDMFFIASVVKVTTDKHENRILRIGLYAVSVIVSAYSMFHVWMGAGSWNHAIYHSLLGSW